MSFFVADQRDRGILKDELLRLGERFSQESVIWIPKSETAQEDGPARVRAFFLGTSRREGMDPPYGQLSAPYTAKFGERPDVFFSRIGGRPFVFNKVEEIARPGGIAGFAAAHASSGRIRALMEINGGDAVRSRTGIRGTVVEVAMDAVRVKDSLGMVWDVDCDDVRAD